MDAMPPFFARGHHEVTALDLSDGAITACRSTHRELPISFLHGALPDLCARFVGGFDVVYSRFVIHAMPLPEEIDLLRAAARALKPDGVFFIECRSIHDPMARLGKVISPTERLHGHYRRFLVLDELVERLVNAGFRIVEKVESAGLAVHGAEDPVVIRIKAQRCLGVATATAA
jgi:2-polyprenyl-3-methyl-5-hydroxy-6-metoxy-1,4-benzoquinol methylase